MYFSHHSTVLWWLTLFPFNYSSSTPASLVFYILLSWCHTPTLPSSSLFQLHCVHSRIDSFSSHDMSYSVSFLSCIVFKSVLFLFAIIYHSMNLFYAFNYYPYPYSEASIWPYLFFPLLMFHNHITVCSILSISPSLLHFQTNSATDNRLSFPFFY